MKIEIYPILPVEVEGRFLLDLEQRVACVEFDLTQHKGRLSFDDPSYEKLLRGLFEEDCAELVGEIEGGDAVQSFPAWTKEALDIVVRDKLKRYTLGARPAPSQDSSPPARNS